MLIVLPLLVSLVLLVGVVIALGTLAKRSSGAKAEKYRMMGFSARVVLALFTVSTLIIIGLLFLIEMD